MTLTVLNVLTSCFIPHFQPFLCLPPQILLFLETKKFSLSVSQTGGLEVACWPLVPKFAGSQPAEAVGFLVRKNPQHAFLRRGSKAVGRHVVALRLTFTFTQTSVPNFNAPLAVIVKSQFV
jgi:hypothetical protein